MRHKLFFPPIKPSGQTSYKDGSVYSVCEYVSHVIRRNDDLVTRKEQTTHTRPAALFGSPHRVRSRFSRIAARVG